MPLNELFSAYTIYGDDVIGVKSDGKLINCYKLHDIYTEEGVTPILTTIRSRIFIDSETFDEFELDELQCLQSLSKLNQEVREYLTSIYKKINNLKK